MRNSGRKANELRKIQLIPHYNPFAEGSCLVKFGDTHVICTATLDDQIPPFIRNTGSGWVTAEYSMLPRATQKRSKREISQGRPNGRTQEIQRLIGRSLRTCVNLAKLGEKQIIIDCDVIQADGGTRTASITGGYVALALAIRKLEEAKQIRPNALISQIAAISCGVYENKVLLDLDYQEDSLAGVDSNFVLDNNGNIVEIQASSEAQPFAEKLFFEMFGLAKPAVKYLCTLQNEALMSS